MTACTRAQSATSGGLLQRPSRGRAKKSRASRLYNFQSSRPTRSAPSRGIKVSSASGGEVPLQRDDCIRTSRGIRALLRFHSTAHSGGDKRLWRDHSSRTSRGVQALWTFQGAVHSGGKDSGGSKRSYLRCQPSNRALMVIPNEYSLKSS